MSTNINLKNSTDTTFSITHSDGANTKVLDSKDIAVAIDTVADFPANPNNGDVVIVRDLNRGGTFIYDSSEVAGSNDGTNFSGWIRQYSGAVNVKWFGAVGDGVTDDTVAMQKAVNASYNIRKTLYFPSAESFYNITSPLNAIDECHWIGENSLHTIIRNTSGGVVITCNGTGQLGPYVFEHLRFGGYNATGLALTSGGYADYIARATFTDCHWEGDLRYCVNANIIYFNATDCSFGAVHHTIQNPLHQHIIASSGGSNNTNVNHFLRCMFHNSHNTSGASVLSGGMNWNFTLCDWTLCHQAVVTSNIHSLVFDNCYTEQCEAANYRGVFHIGASLTKTKVLGGIFLGGNLVSGASMFSAGSTGGLLVDNASIETSSVGYTFYDNSAVSHNTSSSGIHLFENCRITGNTSDPIALKTSTTLANNGNLLVGTTTDNGVNKLQVNGSIKATVGIIRGVDINIYGQDLNLLRTAGIYGGDQLAHSPLNNLNDWYYVEVVAMLSGNWAMQRATTFGTSNTANRTFQRCFTNGTTWTNWREF